MAGAGHCLLSSAAARSFTLSRQRLLARGCQLACGCRALLAVVVELLQRLAMALLSALVGRGQLLLALRQRVVAQDRGLRSRHVALAKRSLAIGIGLLERRQLGLAPMLGLGGSCRLLSLRRLLLQLSCSLPHLRSTLPLLLPHLLQAQFTLGLHAGFLFCLLWGGGGGGGE